MQIKVLFACMDIQLQLWHNLIILFACRMYLSNLQVSVRRWGYPEAHSSWYGLYRIQSFQFAAKQMCCKTKVATMLMEHSHQIIGHYVFVCVWKQPNPVMNSFNSNFWHKAITSCFKGNFNPHSTLIINVTIRQQIGLEETVVKEIEQNQLTWHGYVHRMAEGRLPKIALKWMPKQKRAWGRPKKNWMEGIRKAMN